MTRKTLILAVVLGVAGCSTSRTSKLVVSDQQLARVPLEALDDVNDWRLRQAQANDRVVRTELLVRDAERDVEVARAEVKVAQAEKDRARKAHDAASRSRDRRAVETAEDDYTAADLQLQAARARVEAAQANVRVAEAQHEVARRESQATRIRLEQAKFHALQRAQDPAADAYSQKDYDRALKRSREQIQRANKELQARQQGFAQARNRWQDLVDRQQASAPQPPRG